MNESSSYSGFQLAAATWVPDLGDPQLYPKPDLQRPSSNGVDTGIYTHHYFLFQLLVIFYEDPP